MSAGNPDQQVYVYAVFSSLKSVSRARNPEKSPKSLGNSPQILFPTLSGDSPETSRTVPETFWRLPGVPGPEANGRHFWDFLGISGPKGPRHLCKGCLKTGPGQFFHSP